MCLGAGQWHHSWHPNYRQTVNLLENAPERLSLETLNFLNPDVLKKIVLIHDGKTRTLMRETREWQEGTRSVHKEEPMLQWLEKVSKLEAGGYRDDGTSNGEPLFRLALVGDNAWNISVSFDPAVRAYVFRFGDGKPSMYIEEKVFAAFYEELRLGKFAPKI